MSKRLLTYFILSLVALTSAAGISDAHQLHQLETDHLTFDEGHHYSDSLHNFHLNHKEPLTEEEWDCGHCFHCCYCSGHFSLMNLLNILNFTFQRNISEVFIDNSEDPTPESIDPLLRPPIA